MKNCWIKIISAIAIALVVVSCSKDDADAGAPEIQSFYVSKSNNVLFSEELTLKATVSETSQSLTYTWECPSGEIIGTGNQVKWKAPSQIGDYTLKVKVSNGNDTVVSTKEVHVVGAYYYDFAQTSSQWSKSSNGVSSILNGYLTLYSSDTVNSAGIGYNLPAPYELPYSFKTRMAVNLDNFSSTSALRASYYFYFPDLNIGTSYLKSIALHIIPGANSWILRAGIHDAETGTVIYQNLESNSSLKTKVIFTENNQFHTIGMAISADKTLIINVDGEEMYRTTVLATNPDYNRDLTLSKYSYSVDPRQKLIVDDFYLTNDQTVLK